jgi:hypothetical protein
MTFVVVSCEIAQLSEITFRTHIEVSPHGDGTALSKLMVTDAPNVFAVSTTARALSSVGSIHAQTHPFAIAGDNWNAATSWVLLVV